MSVTDEMVCFSLYTAARATTRAYRSLLSPWDLTYPQYLTLVLLWTEGDKTVRELGEAMQLDSGTLSPLIRRLEKSGYVQRTRTNPDERIVTATLTPQGQELRASLAHIPAEIRRLMSSLTDTKAMELIGALQTLCTTLQDETPARPNTTPVG